MRTESDGLDGKQTRAIAICAAAFGFALLALAFPRIVAQSEVAPWGDVVSALRQSDRAVAPEYLAAARRSYEAAARWQPADARLQQDLAMILGRPGPGGEVSAAEQRAVLYDTAAAGPARPLPWAMLAAFEQAQGGEGSAYIGYLRLSALLGPYEAMTMVQRANAGVRGWSDLPPDLRDVVKRDLRRMWLTPGYLRNAFVSLYLRADFPQRKLVRALALESPEEMARFDKYILKSVSGGTGASSRAAP